MPDSVFKAMADATRRKILQILSKTELSVSEMVDVLRLPQSTVSRHLKVLRDAGLVTTRHLGTAAIYSPAAVQDAAGDGLRARMLVWSKEQDLPRAMDDRLQAVVRRRRSESDAFFAGVAHRWDQMRVECFGPSFHLEALSALLPADWVVADVGAGTGYMLPHLAASFARVIAVDPVEEMLSVARERAAGLGNIEFRQGDASALPMATGEVDLCIASLVLHHEPNPGNALLEMARVVKPGGMILIVEEAAHQSAEFHELMQDRWWGFDVDKFLRLVKRAGFAEVRSRVLRTAVPTSGTAPESPELFVVTGRKSVRAGR